MPVLPCPDVRGLLPGYRHRRELQFQLGLWSENRKKRLFPKIPVCCRLSCKFVNTRLLSIAPFFRRVLPMRAVCASCKPRVYVVCTLRARRMYRPFEFVVRPVALNGHHSLQINHGYFKTLFLKKNQVKSSEVKSYSPGEHGGSALRKPQGPARRGRFDIKNLSPGGCLH